MGTTATKLEYLNDTKQLLKENINSLGGNLTTEPFRQYASVLEDIYERIPKVSGIGTSLSLSPTMAGKIKLNEIQGDTLQDGTPTPDTPVEIQNVTGLQNVGVCGKNLFDIDTTTNIIGGTKTNNIITSSSYSSGSWVGMTISFSPISITEEFTISMDLRLTSGSTGTFNKINDGFTNFTEISKPTISENWQRYVYKYTPSSGYSINKFYIQMLSINGQYECRNIQLEQGSTATSYEPYKGNTYEVNLGKNLFNKYGDFTYGNTRYQTSLNSEGQIVTTANYSNGRSAGLLIENLKENTTYCLSGNLISAPAPQNPNNIIIDIMSGTNNAIIRTCGISSSTTKPYNFNFTFNTGDNTSVWISFNNFYSASDTNTYSAIFDNVQLELGDTQTEYSPYFTPIELNKIGDYQDRIYKDNGKWYIEKKTNKYVIDTSQIALRSNYTNVEYATIPKATDYIYYNQYHGEFTGYLCTNAIATINATNWDSSDNIEKIYTGANLGQWWMGFAKGTGLTTIQEKLNGAYIIYPLATPEITEITNEELINQLESIKSKDGTTNISITSEDLEMILNVSALKGDVE